MNLRDRPAPPLPAVGREAAPERALEVWHGLREGRWSLVDYVDAAGQAFVLAVRNELGGEFGATLTDRQRAAIALAALGQGNKEIACSLGLTEAAVAMLLARARAATGLRTRAALVCAFKRDAGSRA
jgi:DNA-binding CsgD family transcriptional regulator